MGDLTRWMAQKVGRAWWLSRLEKAPQRPRLYWERQANRDMLTRGLVQPDTRKLHFWALSPRGAATLRALEAEGRG